MHICVLGAGVIGTTSAYQLLEAGHQVTLLDAKPVPASGASLGNGAQLSYSYVAPLADPSVWSKWPYYLASPNSPLTLRPWTDSAQWGWLLQFLAACTPGKVRSTTIELLRLAFFSREQLARLRGTMPFDFLHRTAGKLVMFSDANALQLAKKQIDFQAEHGCEQEIVDAGRCLGIEPALVASGRKWAGGVYTPSEEVGDCALFCQRLLASMKNHPGFEFLPSMPISRVEVKNRVLRSVWAGSDNIQADAFVLAMGAESAAFASKAGFSVPIYPLKGYSITVPLGEAVLAVAPQVSITDLSRKIVYARLGDRMRVAGRVELVGMNPDIPKRAIDELTRAVAETFPGCVSPSAADGSAWSPWAGFRPATPTGLPIIGPSPVENLYLNVGHGSLGWTLACGSAALLAQQIDGKATAIDTAAFRFNG
ncbi:MAG TPA: D-amino acid dehydrogenase [Burkholderiaceae bacterium]|nr:D-amino acid dehydrogenase [Burkholderiaceae bacterium]